MSSKAYSNVFSAFSRGLSNGPTSTQTLTAPTAPTPDDALAPYRALLALAETPEGRLPFTEFGRYLPGDNVGTLSATLQLMKHGWVEFVGDISETSEVRLTPSGHDLVETFRKSVAEP